MKILLKFDGLEVEVEARKWVEQWYVAPYCYENYLITEIIEYSEVLGIGDTLYSTIEDFKNKLREV